MFNLTEMVLKLRLAPASERYQRFANRGDAMAFACDLRDAVPNIGTRVYFGAPPDMRKRSQSSTLGYVVALADDRDAPIAAGAGRLVAEIGFAE